MVLLVSLVGCDKKAREINPPSNPANEPQAIINPPHNNILETYVVTYVVDGDGEVSSTLILKSNNVKRTIICNDGGPWYADSGPPDTRNNLVKFVNE